MIACFVEKNDTTDTDRSALYIDLHIDIDSEGWIRTKLYDKRDYFNFPLRIFHFHLYVDIPAALTYGVYMSLS